MELEQFLMPPSMLYLVPTLFHLSPLGSQLFA